MTVFSKKVAFDLKSGLEPDNDPMEIELFTVEHTANPKGVFFLGTSLRIGYDELTLKFFQHIGKEKEYKEYLAKINDIFVEIADEINVITFDFFREELSDSEVPDVEEKSLSEKEKEEVIRRLLEIWGN